LRALSMSLKHERAQPQLHDLRVYSSHACTHSNMNAAMQLHRRGQGAFTTAHQLVHDRTPAHPCLRARHPNAAVARVRVQQSARACTALRPYATWRVPDASSHAICMCISGLVCPRASLRFPRSSCRCMDRSSPTCCPSPGCAGAARGCARRAVRGRAAGRRT